MKPIFLDGHKPAYSNVIKKAVMDGIKNTIKQGSRPWKYKMAKHTDPYCPSHKPNKLGYIEWQSWATNLQNQGARQIQCSKCLRFLFPEEI